MAAAIVGNTCMLISSNACMLNVISDNSVPLSVFRLIVSALLLVLSASSVMVGLPFSVNQLNSFSNAVHYCYRQNSNLKNIHLSHTIQMK